jgi:hypothetical protein
MKNSCLLILLLLCGCATAPVHETPALGIDGIACVGQVPEAVPGLAGDSNDTLIAAARAPSDKGGVCTAAAFTATGPLRVYRVYDSARGNPAFGRWWSLTPPQDSREQYRAAYAICPEWSTLDRLVVCNLKPGTKIVLGTTQSVQCETAAYLKTADIQVYIPNDWQTQTAFVDDCEDKAIWQ